MKLEYQNTLVNATSQAPCPHCGKPDWCYTLGDLSVCCRDIEPTQGWYKTSKTDKDNHYFYAPISTKKTSKRQDRTWEYFDKKGNKIARYHRIDYGNGKKPTKFQEHWNGDRWVKGWGSIQRSQIPVYRYAEIREAITNGETIYIVAGEKCADAMWSIGLPATTNIAGEGKWEASDTKCLEGAVEVVICPDRDAVGVKAAYKLADQFPDALWLYTPPSQFFWLTEHLPPSKGLDVADWIEAGADKELVTKQISNLSPDKFSASLPLCEKPLPLELSEKPREVLIEAEEIFTQKAVDCLYSDAAYIAIHDKIYRFNGTHYEVCSVPRERRKIAGWCNTTPIQKNGKLIYDLARPECVDKIWRWALTQFSVDSEDVNPPGINCLNGVVRISYRGRKVSYELVPHSSEFYFTHVANFEYDIEADDRDCDRLLAALDPIQQKIFLRTIAASIDLATVRKHQGRAVKALLCQGTGSNGKDTLREAVKCILGAGMSSASVTDFQQYDSGRKFPLTKIEHSLINWSSENSQFARLDSLQGLKAAITGDPIDIEPKNAAEYEITPRGVFLFNVNEAPLLEGGMEAIASRWAVLRFNKTFKKNADPTKGELEADSRFRYDPDFLETSVCPALLNKILAELQNVILEGIDYSAVENALQKIQEQSNHLWQFINETGIQRSPGSRLYISDLWRSLEQWYKETGTLEIEQNGDRQKKIWHDQPRKSDRNVTAKNQVGRRFRELFPDCELLVHRERENGDRRGQAYLMNLVCSGSAMDRHKTLTQSSGSDGSAKIATLATLVKDIEHLDETEILTAITIMEKFISRKSNVAQNADPSDPAHSTKVPCRSIADPLQRQHDPNLNYGDNKQELKELSHTASETNLTVNVNNAFISPENVQESHSNDTIHIEHKPIDWVRDKEGVVYQIDEQIGEFLRGHRSGLRGYKEMTIHDCSELNYKDKTRQVMT